MYTIENNNADIGRAWHAHKIEQKCFYDFHGSFLFVTIQLDNFSRRSGILTFKEWIINPNHCEVLHVPGDFANVFRSLTGGSRLLVFSDSRLKESTKDDSRFEPTKR